MSDDNDTYLVEVIYVLYKSTGCGFWISSLF